jgi:serine O-acetyltransferase
MREELKHTIAALSQLEGIKDVCHEKNGDHPMPSIEVLAEIVQISRSVLFPGFYGKADVSSNNLEAHIQENIERLFTLLSQQIKAGLCFNLNHKSSEVEIQTLAETKAIQFISTLPSIRGKLHTDVIAAYNGDPAAKSFGEIIFCYPSIRAISNYRIANTLLHLDVPLIPRIITEMAHSETGIDIHPGATIGEYFTIDHGTGVVIGETATIGNNVKMYQGVTLGAKSFPLDKDGNPIKGIPRHPHIGDNVIIYSNSTILGTITVGDGAVIGGNLWVDADVPRGAKLAQQKK